MQLSAIQSRFPAISREFLGHERSSLMSVVFNKTGKIFRIQMNRPRTLNALNREMLDGLRIAFEHAAQKDNTVVVLEGNGGNFCSGADMSLLGAGLSAPESLKLMRELGRVILTMKGIPQPVVVKVRGVAYGGGANLALAGDLVVAADNARFREVFVNINTILDAGGSYFLPRLVGLARAKQLALLGDEFDGQFAASIGLICRSVPDQDLDSQTDEMAENLSKKPLQALILIKEGLERGLEMTLPEVLEREAAFQAIMFQTEEHKKAVREFLSRKKQPKSENEAR